MPSPRSTKSAAPAAPTPARNRKIPPLPQMLSYRLLMLHKAAERASAFEFAESLGLSPSDGRALATLGAFEPLSVVELAEACSLNKSQASRAADSLVAQGLVHKGASAVDGRGVVLTLTPAGRTLCARTTEFIGQRSQTIFSCLSAKEQAQMGEYLDRLVRHNQKRSPVVMSPK